jgi:hypothetical protein
MADEGLHFVDLRRNEERAALLPDRAIDDGSGGLEDFGTDTVRTWDWHFPIPDTQSRLRPMESRQSGG